MKEPRNLRIYLSWFLAVADAQKGNFAPLIELLSVYFPSQPDPPVTVSFSCPKDEKSWKEWWLQWQGALAAEREGRLMLAELLSRSTGLKKKRGAQQTPLFKLSLKERYRMADNLALFFQYGVKKEKLTLTAIPLSDPDDVRKMIPREQRRGKRIKIKIKDELKHFDTFKRERMSKSDAMRKAAEMLGVTLENLAKYRDGKITFGRRKETDR
jgi:hypothetical protein